jgi:putative DNA primase/helicase
MPPVEFTGLPPILAYCHGKRWAIFPVLGKEPLTPHGFKDASADPEQWLRWGKEHPGCGWALPTGERNGVDVVDADTPEAVADLEKRLPACPRVRTGRGGMHFYLKHSPGLRNWTKRLPGVDFRGEGGYVVLPDTIHENGQPYRWVEGTAELAIPETPAWLYELHIGTKEPRAKGAKYQEGERNDGLFRVACAIRAKGGQVLKETRTANHELCSPPLDDDEVRRIAESAERYPPTAAAPTSTGRLLFSPTGEPDRAAFVEAAMSTFSLAALQDSEELLIYRDGQYVTGAQPILKGWIEAQFRHRGETAYTSFITETIAAIGRRTYVPRKEFNPPGFVCLANGILDLTNPAKPVLRPQDPTIRFTAKMPVAYDSTATCPTFDRFLVEVLPSEADRTEVRKMFGYCLVPGNPLQIAFMFIGEGANGKSTLLGVLCATLGEDNVTAETLQSLVTNRFATAKLWGKRANICADIPANPIAFTGTMKTLTGGDLSRAENKFGHPFYFVNDTKLIFSANELPEVNDRTVAFWRRWFMVRFTQTFIGKEDRKLPERLKAELSGILNFALLGLADLAEDGEFKPTQTSEALALEWKQRADPVYWFVSVQVDKVAGAWISKEDLYEAYVQFCETHGASPRKPEVFGKLLPNHAPWARTERRTIGGRGSVRGWLGLLLGPDVEVEGTDRPTTSAGSSRDLTGWAGKTGSPTSVPGAESTLNGVSPQGALPSGPGAEEELPAHPAHPDRLPSDGPSANGPTPDPEDLFEGGETRTDAARRSLEGTDS